LNACLKANGHTVDALPAGGEQQGDKDGLDAFDWQRLAQHLASRVQQLGQWAALVLAEVLHTRVVVLQASDTALHYLKSLLQWQAL
jgi:hypothetical protein